MLKYQRAHSGQTRKMDAPKLRNHILAEMTLSRQATAHPAVPWAPTINSIVKVLADYKKWLATFEQHIAEKRWHLQRQHDYI